MVWFCAFGGNECDRLFKWKGLVEGKWADRAGTDLADHNRAMF